MMSTRLSLSQSLRARVALLVILLLAFALQFYRLDARTFHGDELHSITEAQQLGQNLDGILYFAFMHLWGQLGTSEFWLRVPSALFAVSAVAVNYTLGRVLANRRTGLLMGLLFATAPFAIEYAQQNRFYSLFLLTASLAYLAFVLYLKRPSNRNLIVLAVSNVLVLGAHFFGILVIASEALSALILTQRLSFRFKLLLLGFSLVLFVMLLISPATQTFFYYWVARITNPYGNPAYTGARGISIAHVAKIPLTFFFFGFGEYVYPLNLAFVVPGTVLLLIMGILGIGAVMKYRRNRAASLLISLGIFPVLLYLVFDPLSPPTLQGAAPRYLIFLLPLFYLMLTMGVPGKNALWIIAPVLLLNAVSLSLYFYGDWSYTDDLINWRVVSGWLGEYMTPQAGMLLDGASNGMAEYYFPAQWNDQNILMSQKSEGMKNVAKFTRIIFSSYDFHTQARQRSTAVLRQIEEYYDPTAVWEKYPLFVYVYDRKRGTPDAYRVDASTGQVSLPTEIYGLEFQDLRLPIPLSVNGRTVESLGAFGLPGLAGQTTRTLVLEQPTTARQIWLMSDVTGATPAAGATLAVLRVTGADGSTQTLPLRAGIETSVWNGQCQPAACTVAYTWRKRLALVGAASYPGSWQEFDASIFAAELTLSKPMLIQSLEVEKVGAQGTLYIWGLVLQ